MKLKIIPQTETEIYEDKRICVICEERKQCFCTTIKHTNWTGAYESSKIPFLRNYFIRKSHNVEEKLYIDIGICFDCIQQLAAQLETDKPNK